MLFLSMVLGITHFIILGGNRWYCALEGSMLLGVHVCMWCTRECFPLHGGVCVLNVLHYFFLYVHAQYSNVHLVHLRVCE